MQLLTRIGAQDADNIARAMQLHATRCLMSPIHLQLGYYTASTHNPPSPNHVVKPRQRSPPNRLAYRWRLSYNVHASHHVLYVVQVDGDAMAVLLRPNGPFSRSVMVYCRNTSVIMSAHAPRAVAAENSAERCRACCRTLSPASSV